MRRVASLIVAAALLAGCAPLSRSIVSLDGSGIDDPAAVARLAMDADHPLLLRGLDGQALPVRVPSALRDWTFVVAPGRHVLWLSSVPAGYPFLPQFIRCYVMEVFLAAGRAYVLRYEPAGERALLLRGDDRELEAVGRLVDKPFVIESACRWPGR